MKYKCCVCGGICDPGELTGGVCFECRRQKGMKKRFFQFAEKVTYMHSVEVEITLEQEEDYEEFCCGVAEKIDNGEYDASEWIAGEFAKKFGEENVGLCEDGSPNVEFEAI